MRIRSFKIQGYKNLAAPVELDGLDVRDVVVIHGSNNVGKSNLLEAMQLPFLLLGLGEERREELPFQVEQPLAARDALGKNHLDPSDWFTLGAPTPIDIQLALTFTPEELRRQNITPVHDCSRVELGLRIDGYPGEVTWRITRYRFADGADAALSPSLGAPQHFDPVAQQRLHKFSLYFARNVIWRRFVLLNLNRQDLDGARARGRGILTDKLVLDLYDARESADVREYHRWDAFVRVCKDFGDVLTGAEPVVTYDRTQQRATLYMQSPAGRLPVHLLGTGVQQLLAIIARMLVSKADVVAVEEPEASVSVGLHARVRDAMQRMTEKGPAQVFLTSHSPWFDGAEDFIAVTTTPIGPKVQWRAVRDAGLFTQQDLPSAPVSPAPLSYVTPEGYVALPPFVRQHLSVEHGGGVVFKTEGVGHVTMLSNDAAIAELGEGDDDEG